MIKLLTISFLAVLTLSLTLPTAAIAAPNENANEKAHERATFQIPSDAVEITPGIYSLGTIESNGVILEGIMSYHHRNGHNGGPGGGDDPIGDPTDSSSCYSYVFGKPLQWASQENWVVNPENNDGLSDQQVLETLEDGFSSWDEAAGTTILGSGSITSDTLVADTQTTDGINEIYFADISEPGVIAVTITWGVANGPPFARGLVEMDQVYDDVSFDFAIDGNPSKMDLGSVGTHEIGHGLGMGHTSLDDLCSKQTMYPYTTNGSTDERSLEAGDIAGIQNVY